MLAQVLVFIFTLALAYTAVHYTLSTVWRNAIGVCVAAAVFALLFVIFVGKVVL